MLTRSRLALIKNLKAGQTDTESGSRPRPLVAVSRRLSTESPGLPHHLVVSSFGRSYNQTKGESCATRKNSHFSAVARQLSSSGASQQPMSSYLSLTRRSDGSPDRGGTTAGRRFRKRSNKTNHSELRGESGLFAIPTRDEYLFLQPVTR